MLDTNDIYTFTNEYWRHKELQDWRDCQLIFDYL